MKGRVEVRSHSFPLNSFPDERLNERAVSRLRPLPGVFTSPEVQSMRPLSLCLCVCDEIGDESGGEGAEVKKMECKRAKATN